MAKNKLTDIAGLSPGVATAAASANLSDKDKQQLAAFAQLKQTHEYLATLPQNDAYRSFSALPKNYQNALTTFFDPKYREKDLGFFGNIARSVKSTANYTATAFKELGMQIAGVPIKPTTSASPAEALLTLGLALPVSTNKETGVSSGAGKVLETLIRPQEKLIKQPYIAERLAEEQGQGGLLQYGKFIAEGAKELLPGGRDAKVTDASTTWKKYWEQASDPESAYDEDKTDEIERTAQAEYAFVAKTLASKKNFIDVYDELLADPKRLEIVQRYTSGRPEDKEVAIQVGRLVEAYERSKISPGRDIARGVSDALFAAFPFEAEKAIQGSTAYKAFFNTISGTVDFTVTFGLDPLILLGKAKKSADIARFGLIKLGEDPRNLDKAWQNPTVVRYWDEIGKLFVQYEKGNIQQKGEALTRIAERFPEINPDVALYLAPNIKNADDALEFFKGADIIDVMSKGNVGLRRDPLIPRYTLARGIKDSLRDRAVQMLGTGKYSVGTLPDTVDDIARTLNENPNIWAAKLGYREAEKAGILAGRREGQKFVAKDTSTYAKIDRVVRQFAIAPSQEKLIKISDASSATQVYRLVRTVADKNTASIFRAAWINATEGQRLLMYKGIIKTLSYGMGIDLTASGKRFLDSIDSMTTELYSVNQSTLDLGEFSRLVRTTSAGTAEVPSGIRALVADATEKADAGQLAIRLAASTGAEMADMITEVNKLKELKKELLARRAVSSQTASKMPREEFDTVVQYVLGIPEFNKVQARLRGIELDYLKKPIELDAEQLAFIEKFNNTIARTLLPKNLTVYRATNNRAFLEQEVGSIVREPGFTSTSKDAALTAQRSGEVKLEIKLQKGQPGLDIEEAYKAFNEKEGIHYAISEKEILLPSNMEFRILSREGNNVVVEAIPPKGLGVAEEAAIIEETIADINKSIALYGGMLGKTRMARNEIKKLIEEVDPADIDLFNAAELNGGQYAVRAYQLSDARYMPNLIELRQFELKGNVLSALTGRVGESIYSQKMVDIWSYLNLYPRLGIRTTIEEVGTYGLINGTRGVAGYIQGRLASQKIRQAQAPGSKVAAFSQKVKEVSPLGIISNQVYKILGKNYSPAKIAAMAEDKELMAETVGKSMLMDRFRPQFLQTAKGKQIALDIEDAILGDTLRVSDDINGAAYKAEFKQDIGETTQNLLKDYGPSVAYNVDIAEALKNQKFSKVYSQIQYNRPEFLLSWYIDLHNTIGKKNIWGKIVFDNIYKKEEDVIEILVNYFEGAGKGQASRSAIYEAKGPYGLAKAVYLDATNALRDFSGRLNKKLIEEIKASGGIKDFNFQQLAKYEENYQFPKAVLGRELIPLTQNEASGVIDRIMKNGYGWIGKQVALLDREPIFFGNYFMFRDELRTYQNNLYKGFVDSGIEKEAAEKLARAQAADVATDLARQRTIGYMDNADVRTNLAFSVRNFGRYYRATEDFYRRAARIGKYEKEALMRLAITNQSFQHSGFVHEDANGELYFTYPGDDILGFALDNTLFRFFGVNTGQPLSVNFGGKVKMLTPSLDPESAALRLSGPLISAPIAVLNNLPGVGNWLRAFEPVLTGSPQDVSWWRKLMPINVQRTIDIIGSQEVMTDQKYSALVQSARMLNSIGQGPTTGAEIEPFANKLLTQATNIMFVRLIGGLGAPASVQQFATTDVPKEMINAGYYTWDSEFSKILQRYAGDPEAYSRALTVFATLYPTKLVYTVSKTTSGTEAGFQKTYEAANFVKNNKDFVENHKQAAAFFMPITGTSDLEAYTYLKAQGFVKNKIQEDFLREASTAEARQIYNARKEYYDNAITSTNSIELRRRARANWANEKNFLKSTYPLLAQQLENNDGYKALKQEALDDLRGVVYGDKAPNKELQKTFAAMIYEYDSARAALDANAGASTASENRRTQIKENLRAYLKQIAGQNPNAISLYWNVFDALIGE